MIDRRLRALLRCPQPGCGGALTPRRGGTLLGCRACPALYPVLADVPILVPSPHVYLASYRDPVLATLAAAGCADRDAVALIDAFAEAAGPTEPLAFGDDWTRGEGRIRRPTAATDDDAIAAWLASAPDPGARLAEAVPDRARIVVELGCGDNRLSALLARRGRTVVVADLSLRAAVRTRDATGAIAVVLDAAALPLAPASIDAIVAANLIDLLDEPGRFLADAAAAVRPDGRVIVSTPAPALGTDDDGALARGFAAAGLPVVASTRGLPWLRAHSPRHYQLYFADLVVGARVSDRDRSPRRARDRGRARPPSS